MVAVELPIPTKPRLHGRYVQSACLFLLVLLLLLHRHPSLTLRHHIQNIHKRLFLRPSNDITDKWEPPPPLRELVPFKRGSEEAEALKDHPWTRPRVLLTYARPSYKNASHTQVFLYATGVRMGKYERNVTVAGCLVGLDVFAVESAPGDVYICTADRVVGIGEHVSLVLLRDAVLDTALTGMVLGGLDVTLKQTDLGDLPERVRIRVREMGESDKYAVLTSGGTVSHIAPGVETLRNRARYKVCMGTQMKTFPHLLQDWVSYHRKLGVDQVYILDNAAEKPLESFLSRDVTGVETVYWPFQKSQIQAMSFLLVSLRERCEWVLLSDADEYVLLGVDNRSQPANVRDYLDRIPGEVEQHYLPYLTMGISGHVELPKGPVAEEYTYKHARQKHNGKTFARTDVPWMSSKIHVAWWPRGRGIVRSGVENDEPAEGEQGVLVHFQKRSFEEMMMKRSMGSGSLGDVQIGDGKRKLVTDVPRDYREVDESLRYTFFRDVWRIVELEEAVTCLVRGDERRMV